MKAQNIYLRPNKDILSVARATAAILLIPLVAMLFTDEVQWGLFDFFFMGALLFGAGLIFVLVARRIRSTKYRVILGVTLLVLLLITWVELAVGIFD